MINRFDSTRKKVMKQILYMADSICKSKKMYPHQKNSCLSYFSMWKQVIFCECARRLNTFAAIGK